MSNCKIQYFNKVKVFFEKLEAKKPLFKNNDEMMTHAMYLYEKIVLGKSEPIYYVPEHLKDDE